MVSQALFPTFLFSQNLGKLKSVFLQACSFISTPFSPLKVFLNLCATFSSWVWQWMTEGPEETVKTICGQINTLETCLASVLSSI